MHKQAIFLSFFTNKVLVKYGIDNFDHQIRKNVPRKNLIPHMKLRGYTREK